jgi:membrane-bound inhibitor of C-type lysozyme
MNIQADHRKWNDEAVFNEARKHVIAHHQASSTIYYTNNIEFTCMYTYISIEYFNFQDITTFDNKSSN